MGNILRGRRLEPMAKAASKYISSTKEDEMIKGAVIDINSAHVLALYKAGWLDRETTKEILGILEEAKKTLTLDYELEDVHMCLEKFVIDRLGSKGGFLSLGRSRNDQVAGALRTKVREETLSIMNDLVDLLDVMVALSKKNQKKLLPGYTHMQPAQPTTASHWILSYVDALLRDFERFKEAYLRVNLSPLGAAALSGSTAYIDRNYISSLLGFDGLVENTMDAVSARDFICDVVYAASSLMVTMSRLSQDLIYFSSLGLLKIPDKYVSTSSIMPQKRNAVVAETQRAMTSSTISHLMAIMNILKSLNSTYNLDFQEITRHLWMVIKDVKDTLKVFIGMLSSLEFDEFKAERISKSGFVTASDLAEYLSIKYGVPFRDAHKIVGSVMKKVEGRPVKEGELARELAKAARRFAKLKVDPKEFIKIMDPKAALKARRAIGAPNPKEISRMIQNRKDKISSLRKWLDERYEALEEARMKFRSEILMVRG